MDITFPQLGELIQFVKREHPEGDALEQLSHAMLLADHLGETADHLVGHFVDQARRAGASWTEIGRSMGVTKQAAQKRFVTKRAAELGAAGPGGVWSAFTDEARRVVVGAQEEARQARHDYIGTEHIVLALLREGGSVAVRAVESLASADAVREAVTGALGPAVTAPTGHIPFTARAKESIDRAVEEARRLGHTHVGPEHLLLGVLGDEGSVGAQFLIGTGVTKAAAEAAIARLLDE
ncbi:ATP-dependent Clp protease ATP-binding subunit [Microbispora sp. RL4-1S]|uniref:ATP-dependent Clp protease ATP-binding subunit n=1 Tax=Microbispora oryzae TaxID=2806554 RepID=A0A941APE8_9ACTN|nr:Clp protease N-terminal domain-containing protein [Microbispora oryzae]MBP2703634.1 ATP-dependent Clp protease ATP-binding subunit [Microbispora oryzae]